MGQSTIAGNACTLEHHVDREAGERSRREQTARVREHLELDRVALRVQEEHRRARRRRSGSARAVRDEAHARALELVGEALPGVAWLNPSDPDFEKKAAKICRLYVSPPANATVLSLDEKPGIQALRRPQPDRPLRKGKPARLEFEYERCGTRNLFAAFNIKTGHVVAWLTPDRSTSFVLAFLDHLARFYRATRSSGPTQGRC